MKEKLIEEALEKFRQLEREVDEAAEALAEKQRELIAHGNYLRKLQKG